MCCCIECKRRCYLLFLSASGSFTCYLHFHEGKMSPCKEARHSIRTTSDTAQKKQLSSHQLFLSDTWCLRVGCSRTHTSTSILSEDCIFIYLLHALRRKFSRRCLRLARKLAHSEVGLLGCLCGGKRSLCNIH